MCCQGTVKSCLNSYVARLNHSDAKYFKAQTIKHNNTANKKRDVQMVTQDHHSREVYGEIFIHQLPVNISCENINDCPWITIYLSMAGH